MLPTEVTLYRFAAQWEVLPQMVARLELLCQPCEQHLRFRAMTAMEELFANFIQHGGGNPREQSSKQSSEQSNQGSGEHPATRLPADPGTIGFSVQATADALIIHYQDDGPAFNPFQDLEVAASHIHLRVEDRPVGGLGRLLVSRLADTARYARQGPLNCIELRFVRRAGF